MKDAVNEFKLWTVFLAVGVVILATEVAVKATRPSADKATAELLSTIDASKATPVLPEELVAHLLIESVVQVESGGRPRTVGLAGERGLMQVMEETWRETTERLYGKPISFKRAFEPELNREVGSAYLAYLHKFILANRDKWQASERSLLLACYNAGPNRVKRAGFNIKKLPASTRDYVTRASALHDMMLRKYEMKLEQDKNGGVMQIVRVSSSLGS